MDIKIYQGTNGNFTFFAAGNLTAKEISFVVKADRNISTSTDVSKRLIDKNSLRNEIAVNYSLTANKTTITITLLDSDTYQKEAGNYYYDIKNITDEDVLFSGSFIIKPGVQNVFDDTQLPNMDTIKYFILNARDLEIGDLLCTRRDGNGVLKGAALPLTAFFQSFDINEFEPNDILQTKIIDGKMKCSGLSISAIVEAIRSRLNG